VRGLRISRRRLLAGVVAGTAILTLGLLAWMRPRESEVKLNRGEEVGSPTLMRVRLPEPSYKGIVSIEEALLLRRSIREYGDEPLTLRQVSQLLWAAQGITYPRYGFRTAPSAGATYPLEVYIVVKEGGVEELQAGIYHYLPRLHELELVKPGDYSRDLMRAALDQEWVGDAAINIVINAVYERTTRRYGDRGIRYVHMEVGHVGQNIYLQCVSLGLGCVVIGAFYDEDVKRIIGGAGEPLYIIPVGVKPGGWKRG